MNYRIHIGCLPFRYRNFKGRSVLVPIWLPSANVNLILVITVDYLLYGIKHQPRLRFLQRTSPSRTRAYDLFSLSTSHGSQLSCRLINKPSQRLPHHPYLISSNLPSTPLSHHLPLHADFKCTPAINDEVILPRRPRHHLCLGCHCCSGARVLYPSKWG
jgi:hypothetical protein